MKNKYRKGAWSYGWQVFFSAPENPYNITVPELIFQHSDD